MAHRPLRPAVLTLLVIAASCGGSDDGSDAASMPQDSSIRQVERAPLTDADLMGIQRENIAMELPWTENRVTRDPGASPRGIVTNYQATGHDGFDRLVVVFDEASPMPGYDVSIVESGAELPCGGGPEVVSLASSRMLVVRTNPSRAAGETGRHVRVGTSSMDHTRFREGGLVCDDADVSIWAAGIAEGSEVRVLELRAPVRLALDVR